MEYRSQQDLENNKNIGGIDNNGFKSSQTDLDIKRSAPQNNEEPESDTRPTWDGKFEFLMSCIATSVGFGNIWRFPFIALQNGGGAFLIPYLVVLFLVGKPMYYMETVWGQFSSRNSVRFFAISPLMKGVGWGTIVVSSYILSYYVVILALTLYYFVMSFQTELPWAVCRSEWGNTCVPSAVSNSNMAINSTFGRVSSSELYFTRVVLKKSDGIDNGLGAPVWELVVCLAISWLAVLGVIVRGVRSSGKASYFLALFPYVILIVLFIRAVTLEGAVNGILFFITPQWSKLGDFMVWYAAVTQVFFSLCVGTGALVVFASFNKFDQNVYRDSLIVTTLDTFTSLLSGLTIFGILGNLAHELGYEDVRDVVGTGGTGLAFISYPDAIAKFTFVPQLFSVLFFLMLFVLGLGSVVALVTIVNTALLDAFPSVRVFSMSALTCSLGFLASIVYVTPGGQYILELVDHYGSTYLMLFLGIFEVVTVFWIYGLERFCVDIEFMLHRKTSLYWRWSWGVVTPVIMLVTFVSALFSFEDTLSSGYIYPSGAKVAAYVLPLFGILQLPLWAVISIFKKYNGSFLEAARQSWRPSESWGPRNASTREAWRDHGQNARDQRRQCGHSALQRVWWSLNGKYRNGKIL